MPTRAGTAWSSTACKAVPELCSPLLSCPFVLCIATGRDKRADTTQPGKGKTKLLSGQRFLAGGATPARSPCSLPHSPELGTHDLTTEPVASASQSRRASRPPVTSPHCGRWTGLQVPGPETSVRDPGLAAGNPARVPRSQTRDPSPAPRLAVLAPRPGLASRSPPVPYLGVHAGGRHAS